MKTIKCEKNQHPTVCSCRHSKSTVWVRSMHCMETVLCAAVGTASQQYGLEACTVWRLLCAAVGTVSQ